MNMSIDRTGRYSYFILSCFSHNICTQMWKYSLPCLVSCNPFTSFYYIPVWIPIILFTQNPQFLYIIVCHKFCFPPINNLTCCANIIALVGYTFDINYIKCEYENDKCFWNWSSCVLSWRYMSVPIKIHSVAGNCSELPLYVLCQKL